jgi:hypothetical protein
MNNMPDFCSVIIAVGLLSAVAMARQRPEVSWVNRSAACGSFAAFHTRQHLWATCDGGRHSLRSRGQASAMPLSAAPPRCRARRSAREVLRVRIACF